MLTLKPTRQILLELICFFFFLLLISYIAWCSAFTRLSAWSGNCICSPEVSSPRLRCEKKRSYHILESCLSACSYELFETNIRILITLIHIALIPTTLLHHSWCFRTKQHKLYKYSYTYTGTWQAVSFSNLVVGEQIWKVVFFLLSASWMQDFAASMFFDWNYVKCSDCMGTEDSHRVTFLDVLNVAFSWERAFYVSHLSKEVSESVLPCYRVSSALTSTVTAKNSHCKELPLQRTATAKKNRCKEESLQRRVTAKNTRCKEESPQAPWKINGRRKTVGKTVKDGCNIPSGIFRLFQIHIPS